MKIDFQSFQLKLLKFSKYKIFEAEGNEITCKDAINKLKKLRKKGDEKQKYITTFIIFDEKIIKRIDERLDKFTLSPFYAYEITKDKFKILSYCFDISDKNAKNKYHTFLATVSQEEIKCKLKDDFSFIKQYISPFIFLFTGLILFFTYLGFSEYGIPDSYIADIASISFLIIASIIFTLIVVIVSISIAFYLLIPLILCEIFGCSWQILIIGSGIYLFLFFTVLRIKKPLLVSQINTLWIDFIRSLSIVIGVIIIFIFVFLISQSILSSLIKNTNFNNKTAYEFIMSVYFSNYSGYPKILTKNEKTYYLPVKDNRYYYLYDVEEVKKNYFNLLLKNYKNKLDQICYSKQNKLEFIHSYILDNPYIKPKRLKEQIPINTKDVDIHIEDFDMSKLITLNDINVSLCQKVIKKQTSESK